MKGLKAIFGNTAKEIIGELGKTVSTLVTTDDEKQTQKAKLTEIVMSNLNRLYDAQSSVIKAEMSGNFLQKSWRPIMMLTFGVIIVMKWFGYTDANISESLEMELLSIIKLGLGGYVVGRSVEKIATKVTDNIDMTFLKKKDREIN